MNNRNVTLQVIADKAHVSKSLVSRVINNRPVRVSDEKRAQILHIANELDYMPSGEVINVSPMPKLNKTIALILPNLESKFMSTISDTITRKAYENGYSVIVFDSREDNSLEYKYLELCHSLQVSGIIMDSFANANNQNYLKKISEWKIPFLFLDCYPNNSEFSFVTSHNRKGIYSLTESMIKRGHTNILSIIQNKATLTNVSLERLNGYYQVTGEYSLPGYNEIIYPDRDYRQQPIYSLMNSSIEFTAFIIHTGSDVQHFCNLLPLTKYANSADFEIGVFDDFNMSFLEYISGKNQDIYQKIVSLVTQRPQELASTAVDTLIDSIRKGDNFSPAHIFINCDLSYLNLKK